VEVEFRILVVDDDIYSRENIKIALKNPHYFIDDATGYEEAVNKLKGIAYDLLITDLKMPYRDGLELAEYALERKLIKNIILVTGYGDEESIERALKLGVKDFLRKPYDNNDFIRSVEQIYRVHKLEVENEDLKKKLKIENKILQKQVIKNVEDSFQIIGNSRGLETALNKAKEISHYSEICLIHGESGTGKELLARFIHLNGPRRDKPFIAINCAELSPQLFESELFGYVKGAFTGANDNTPGLFEVANHGILFLDEISEIPSSLQAKLLRVIENKSVRRIGDTKWHDIDVQIIASSNRSMEELYSGKFIRKDLFHRLTSSIITLPPLRERKTDIPILVEYFLNKYCNAYGKTVEFPDDNLITKLKNAEWPGNIRQFSNFMRNYVLFGEVSNLDEFNHWIKNNKLMPDDDLHFKFMKGTLEELEQAKYWLVQKILKKYNNNKSKAARHLGMSYPGLHGLLKKMGIEDKNK